MWAKVPSVGKPPSINLAGADACSTPPSQRRQAYRGRIVTMTGLGLAGVEREEVSERVGGRVPGKRVDFVETPGGHFLLPGAAYRNITCKSCVEFRKPQPRRANANRRKIASLRLPEIAKLNS